MRIRTLSAEVQGKTGQMPQKRKSHRRAETPMGHNARGECGFAHTNTSKTPIHFVRIKFDPVHWAGAELNRRHTDFQKIIFLFDHYACRKGIIRETL